MPPFIFRCPNTGFQVQGFAAGDGETEETDVSLWAHLPCMRIRCISSIRRPARRSAKTVDKGR